METKEKITIRLIVDLSSFPSKKKKNRNSQRERRDAYSSSPKWIFPQVQRVITFSPFYVLYLLFFLPCHIRFKMTRFGFLSLALLSLQAFVGTGFAAVSLSPSIILSRVTPRGKSSIG